MRRLCLFFAIGLVAGCTAELPPNDNNSSGFDPSQAEFCDYDPDNQSCTTKSGEPGYCSSESKCLPCDWLAVEGISTSVCNDDPGQDAGASDISQEDTSQDTSTEDTQDDTGSQDTGMDTQVTDTGSGDTDVQDTGSQDTGMDTQDTSGDTDDPNETSFCGNVNAPCVTSLNGLGWCNSQNACIPCERVPGVDFCPGCATDDDCASNEMCDTATNTCVFDPNTGQDTGVDAGADTGSNPDTGSQDTGVDTGSDTGNTDTGTADVGDTTNDTGSQDTGSQPTYETCTNIDGICQAQGGTVGWCAPTQQCIPCSSLTSYNVPACGCSDDSDCASDEMCADISGSAVDICVPDNTGGSDAGMDAGDTADTTGSDVTDTSDTTNGGDTDASDASDTTADTSDASDTTDSGDPADVSDTSDVDDASDASDSGDASDVSDATDSTSDASDTSDAGDTADASDATDSGDATDAADTTDTGDTGSDASDAGSNGVDFDHSGGNTPNLEVYASFANSTYTHIGFMWEYLGTEPTTQNWDNTTVGWEVDPFPTQDSQSSVDIVTFSDYRQDVDYFRFNMKLCDQVDSNGDCTTRADWLCEQTGTSSYALTSGDDQGEVLEVLYEGQACSVSYVASPYGGCSALADCTGISP